MSIVGKWFGFGRDERYDTGVRAFERGEYELAAESFDASMGHADDATTRRLARFYLGQCHAALGHRAMAEGDPAAAAVQFRKALDLHPAYPDLHYHLAAAFGATGQAPEQKAELRLALEINPTYAEALLQLGVLQIAEGQADAGMETVARAVHMSSSVEPDKLAALEEAHRTGDQGRLLELLGALELGPSSAPEPQVVLGDRLVAERKYLEASHAYEAALTRVPQYADVRCKYGQTLLELDRVEDAAEQFLAALAINPKYADAHAYHGIALRRLHRKADAKEAFNRALACNPDHPIASTEASRL